MRALRKRLSQINTNNPFDYSREVWRARGSCARKIDHQEILDLLGLNLIRFSPDEVPPEVLPTGFDRNRAIGFLPKDPSDRHVYVIDGLGRRREAWPAIHEGFHDVFPGHRCQMVPETASTLCNMFVPLIERQANQATAHLRMYPPLFRADVHDLKLQPAVSSLSTLSPLYDSTLEACGNQFARLSDKPVAFFVAETPGQFRKRATFAPVGGPLQARASNGCLFGRKELDALTGVDLRVEEPDLVVSYLVGSLSFPFRLRRGIAVPPGSAIDHASITHQHSVGKMKAVLLGTRSTAEVTVDCRPWGDTGGVIGFMYIPKAPINLPLFKERRPPDEGMFVCESLFRQTGRKRPVHPRPAQIHEGVRRQAWG
jgi:hypothetical protein